MKDGLVFEQPFIDRAEFLHVERSIVHADELVVLRVLIDTERTEAAKKYIVAESASGKVRMALSPKRSPASGARPSLSAWPIGFEEPEGGEQGQPEIVAAVIGEVTVLGEQAQAVHAVVAAIDFALLAGCAGREDEIALFDHHEEEQAIDEAEKVLVVVGWAGASRWLQLRAGRYLRDASGSRCRNRGWRARRPC